MLENFDKIKLYLECICQDFLRKISEFQWHFWRGVKKNNYTSFKKLSNSTELKDDIKFTV